MSEAIISVVVGVAAGLAAIVIYLGWAMVVSPSQIHDAGVSRAEKVEAELRRLTAKPVEISHEIVTDAHGRTFVIRVTNASAKPIEGLQAEIIHIECDKPERFIGKHLFVANHPDGKPVFLGRGSYAVFKVVHQRAGSKSFWIEAHNAAPKRTVDPGHYQIEIRITSNDMPPINCCVSVCPDADDVMQCEMNQHGV